MENYSYKILNFGGDNEYKRQLLSKLQEKLENFLLSKGRYLITDSLEDLLLGKEPVVALYWADGNKNNASDDDNISNLRFNHIPIVPIVSEKSKANDLLPEALQRINAAELNASNYNSQIENITNEVLHLLGLLYKQENVFISYRRSETEEAAKQLHIELVNNGYDAFLDTCDIPIAADFQGELKQRLSDCSALILLESKDFFESKWTKEEFDTANSLRVEILSIKWPEVKSLRDKEFSDTLTLSKEDIEDDGTITEEKLHSIVGTINSLTARYYEARRQSLVSNFINEVKKTGRNIELKINGSISIDGLDGLIVPLIGVPQSWDYYKAETMEHKGRLFLLYDNQCILDSWMDHLKWIESKSNIEPIYVNDNSSWIKENL